MSKRFKIHLVWALALVIMASLTQAAAANTYTVEPWNDCAIEQGTGGWNSGNYDQSGKVYIACGAGAIRVYDAGGARLADIAHGAGTVSDVAPSADGSYLYLARGSEVPRRMSLQPGGGYVLDSTATWSLGKYSYPLDGRPGFMSNPLGHWIATDASGNIYLADGSWVNHNPSDGSDWQNHNTVLKYGPAGNLITRFGERKEGSWQLGEFHGALHGLGVAADGSAVYAVDGNNNRIQRFVLQGGSYQADWAFGSTAASHPDRTTAYCPYDGRMSSPYDVGLDGAGNLFVVNTTCDEVLKFSSAGTLLAHIRLQTGSLPHGFAVSKDGSRVYVQGSQRRAVAPTGGEPPVDPPVEPGPLAPCDRWAAPTGNNGNSGTQAAPYRNIEYLIEHLAAGQTGCLISGQHYDEPSGGFIVDTTNGTQQNPITIRSSDPANPASIKAHIWLKEPADNIIFRNLRFIDSPGPNKSAMLIIGGADGIEFHENEITFRRGICFNVGALDEDLTAAQQPANSSHGFVLSRNRIHHCGVDVALTGADSGVHGVYMMHADGAVIKDNWIYDNMNRGIQLYPVVNDSLIVNNLLDGNGSNLNLSSEVSQKPDYVSQRNLAKNNLITNSVLKSLQFPDDWPDADSAQVWGYGFGGAPRGPNQGDTHGNVVTENCIYQANPAHNFGGWGYAQSDNIFQDPGYENRAAKNFKLAPGSPCSGKGPRVGPDDDPGTPSPTCHRWASGVNGSNANPGTEEQPFATLDRLIASLSAGQTGCLKPTNYFLGDVEPTVISSTAGQPELPIRITAPDGVNAHMIKGRLVLSEDADNVVFEGLNFQGNSTPHSTTSPVTMLKIDGADGIQLRNSLFRHNAGTCIEVGKLNSGLPLAGQVQDGSERFLMVGSLVADCGHLMQPSASTPAIHGLFVWHARGARIIGNMFLDSINRGVQLYPAVSDSRIFHNLIDGNGAGLHLSSEVNPMGYLSEGNIIYRNLITNSSLRRLDTADWNAGDTDQILGYGFGGESRGPNQGDTHGNHVLENCIYRPGDIRAFGGWGFAEYGNVLADPRYVDRGAGNYSLQPGSPCAGMGPVSGAEFLPDPLLRQPGCTNGGSGPDCRLPDLCPDGSAGPDCAIGCPAGTAGPKCEPVACPANTIGPNCDPIRPGPGRPKTLKLRAKASVLNVRRGKRVKVKLVIGGSGKPVAGTRVCLAMPRVLAGAGCFRVKAKRGKTSQLVTKVIRVKRAAKRGRTYRVTVKVRGAGFKPASTSLRVKVR